MKTSSWHVASAMEEDVLLLADPQIYTQCMLWHLCNVCGGIFMLTAKDYQGSQTWEYVFSKLVDTCSNVYPLDMMEYDNSWCSELYLLDRGQYLTYGGVILISPMWV